MDKAFARIAVNVPSLAGEFDYHLPESLAAQIGPGNLVTVPFGKQVVQGVVLDLLREPSVGETRAVLELLDPLPVMTSAQMALAGWLARETLAPLASCIGLMLPAGLGQQADTLYSLNPHPGDLPDRKWSVTQSRLLTLLKEKGSLRGRQVDRHFRNVDWRPSAQKLVREGLVFSQAVLPPVTVRPKTIRTAQLGVPPQVAEDALPGLGKTLASLSRRQAALRCLVREAVELDVTWVYAESSCNLADLQYLAERDLIILRETEVWRDPLQQVERVTGSAGPVPELTPDQEKAWEHLRKAFSPGAEARQPGPLRSFLLHGVTGSGKTELYLRAAQEAIWQGKQAIILVPEIALTPQTVERFLRRFPGQVGLVHSRLSEGERYDTWRRARLGQLKVVIGARSALFAPLPAVGFIAVDECHDASYHQSEPPFYNAAETAVAYARQCGAICVLGSATPSIVQYYHSSLPHQGPDGDSMRLELPHRVENRELPSVQVVDMRDELKAGNRGIFSRALAQTLERTFTQGQQAILFINRRGTASYVFCRKCGETLNCPRCSTPLTYHISSLAGPAQPVHHQEREALLCHHCGYSRQMPPKCPACGSDQIQQYGLGSEKVESEVAALFPSIRTLRWDHETTRSKGSHEVILGHFSAHRADVLIGTQMLAKGLDLPLVTLVGIVLADVGLNLPDPFAAERSFDVLTQVSGRAGRSERGGQVVLQTFQPEHYVIQAAARHDYQAFYTRELEYRRQLGYPPFYRLLRLELRGEKAIQVEDEAHHMAEKLASLITAEDRRETTLIGPTPCYYSKLNGQYRWQIILRGPNPASLLAGRSVAPWRVEVNPSTLL